MKNILLGSIFMIVFLPQLSYGANQGAPTNPQQAACLQQVDAKSVAFFQQQAQERDAFGKANPTVMTAHDLRFKELLAISMLERQGKSAAGLPVPPPEDPIFVAFQEKQRTEGAAFLQQQAQARQNCLTL